MMFRYELKKILGRKSAKVALVVLVIWMIGSLCVVINSTSWVNEENGKDINGLQAIHMNKSEKSKWNGLLTPKIISKVIEENRKIKNNPKYRTKDNSLSNIGFAKTQSYGDIRDMITFSFCAFQSYDYYMIDRLSPKQSALFYSNRINSLKKWVNDDANGVAISDRQKKFYIQCAEALKTPFEYSYMDGWNNILRYCSMILFISIIIICILIAPTFAIEYQTGSDAILLSSKHGKGKAIVAKLMSSYVITTVVYWFSMLAFCGSILAIYGTDGANCMIQTNGSFWKSFYQLTNIEAFWFLLGIGYVGCLLMTSITLWLSAKTKTSFAAIILAFLIIIVPEMLDTDHMPIIVQNIMGLMPHQTAFGINFLKSYNVYSVSDIILTPPQLITAIYLLICVILLPFTFKAFRNHQVA